MPNKERYRFAGPCNSSEVPYKNPAILKVWVDDVEQNHIVIQFKCVGSSYRSLYFYSEIDEYWNANWVGTASELCAMIDSNMLVFGNMRIQMTPKTARIMMS